MFFTRLDGSHCQLCVPPLSRIVRFFRVFAESNGFSPCVFVEGNYVCVCVLCFSPCFHRVWFVVRGNVCMCVCLFVSSLANVVWGNVCVCVYVWVCFFPPLILHLVRNLRGRNVFVCVSPQNHPSDTYTKGKKVRLCVCFPLSIGHCYKGKKSMFVCLPLFVRMFP